MYLFLFVYVSIFNIENGDELNRNVMLFDCWAIAAMLLQIYKQN